VDIAGAQIPAQLDKNNVRDGQTVKIVFRPEDVTLSKTDFLRPGQFKIASARIEEISFVGAYERLRLRMERVDEAGTDESPFYLTTETPESQGKSIIATRPKPEAASIKLRVGERVVVALSSFTVLPPTAPPRLPTGDRR
jgi:ABC-type Fe3+/spermidine/putrescine transport system ATPase subunit